MQQSKPRMKSPPSSKQGASRRNLSANKKATRSVRSTSLRSELLTISGLQFSVHPVLELGQELYNGQLIVRGAINQVKEILSERAFRCFHVSLQRDFFVKNIATEENVQKWIELPAHTNVVTCYDQFFHEGR